MKRKIAGPRPETLIKWSTVLAVSLVAIVAAWISYNHTVSVVTAHGERGIVGRVYAGTIDGLIYSGSMVLLDCARRRIDRPRLAYAMLGSGITATLYVNVISGIQYGVLGSAVAAWPALALVGSFELLMYLVRQSATQAVATNEPEQAATDSSANDSDTVGSRPEELVQPQEELPQAVAEDAPETVPATAPNVVPIKPARTRNRKRSHKTVEQRAADAFGDAIFNGADVPSVRAVQTALKCSWPNAQIAHAHLTQTHQLRTAQIFSAARR